MMASALCISSALRSGRRVLPPQSLSSCIGRHQQQHLRHKHQVRVIVTRDLPEGQMRGVYAGEVHNVAAGYARNYLIPKKMAVYATPKNFERCNLIDPEIAEKEEAAQQQLLADEDEDNEDLQAYDLLRRYLRNKQLKLIRNVDINQPVMCHPGHVSAKHLRDKLSKQLKIDLEDHETIHIRSEPVVSMETKEEYELMELLKEMDEESNVGKKDASSDKDEGDKDDTEGGEVETEEEEEPPVETVKTAGELKDCDTKLKHLGDYVAKITLSGGYVVPLKFSIQRR